jgi:hypothetical protein
MWESNSTFPRAIDVSVAIDGALTAALQGSIERPEELAPIIPEEQEKTSVREPTYNTMNSATAIRESYTTVNKRYVSRESMLPKKVTGKIFLDPLTIEFTATRTYNASNGTNTITVQATMVGGATCGIQLNGSLSYYGNEFGITTQESSTNKQSGYEESKANPFISASFNI